MRLLTGMRLIACALGVIVLTPGHPASADDTVVVGDTLVSKRTFHDVNGAHCIVDIKQLTALPSKLGKYQLTYPKKIQTGKSWKWTLTTTLDDTRPGFYDMTFSFQEEKSNDGCADGGTFEQSFHVFPRLDGLPKELWWFNGEEPANYMTKSKLTAHPANFGPFTWSDFFNSAQVVFKHGTQSGGTLTTSKNNVELSATESFSLVPPEIQLTVNGVATSRSPVTVNRPASLHRFIKPDADVADPNLGYISFINYKILDRFGKVLPNDVPVIEHFTGPVIKDPDFPNPQWPRGDQVGGTVAADHLFDTISGCPSGLEACERPIPLPPRQPHRGHRKINHWSGQIAIGSAVGTPMGQPARGVVVQQHVWQRFQDHARHCDIASPPGVTPTPGCPGLR